MYAINRWLFSAKVLINLIQGVFPVIQAYIIGQLLNTIVSALSHPSADTSQVYWLLTLSIILYAIASQLRYLYRYISLMFGLEADRIMQASMLQHVISLDFSYYEDTEFQSYIQKIDENRSSVEDYSDDLLQTLSTSVQLITSGIAVILFNPILVILITITLIPSMWIEAQANLKRFKSWDQIGNYYRLMKYDRNLILNPAKVKEIKIFRLEHHLVDLWKKHFDLFKGNRQQVEKERLGKESLVEVADTAMQIGIQLWLLAKLLSRTPGFGLGQFQFYRQIIQDFANATTSLISGVQKLHDDQLYAEDYFKLFDYQPRIKNEQSATRLPKDQPIIIEFRNVTFYYPNTDQPVLKNFNLTINAGEHVAIVGANGAGKSTIIKLLMRFYDVTEGSILINGTDIRQVNLQDWYAHIGILFQDFNAYSLYTVLQNIGFGDITEIEHQQHIYQASIQAGSDQFIQKYPEKYEQVLDKSWKNGTSPSGGQWQRIALARAFFRNASILILDEPTSAIDAQGEFEIFEEINRQQADKTTIIISHRFSTVRQAGHIVVLENGQIAEQGSHQQLMSNRGTYHRLFTLQAQGYR